MNDTARPAGPRVERSVTRSARVRLPGPVASALLLSTLLLVGGCAFPPSRSGSGADTMQIVSHTVSSGETLESIADDYYGTPRGATYLAEVNGVDLDYQLEPGALLDVPVGEADIERYRRRTEAKILYNRGTTLANSGDYAKAQEEFAASLKADPRFVDAAYNLGVVLLSNGEPERAAAVFEQALRVRPDEPSFEFALGKAHFDAGRLTAALDHFERALELDPMLEDARFARAVALLKLGERDEAIFALDLYLREFPDGAWAGSARTELEKLAREAGGATP